MKKYFTKEIRIAIVVIIAIVLLFMGMTFLKGMLSFSDDNTYKVEFKDLSGLTTSTPVYINGYKVGVVKDINFNYEDLNDRVIVYIGVDKRMHIPAGATAEIDSDLMGNMKLNLVVKSNKPGFIEPEGTIPGGINEGAMGELKNMIPTVQAMLPKLDSILASVNTLLSDPAITATLHNTEALTANLQASTSQLNTLMAQMNKQTPGILAKVNSTMANTEVLTGKLAAVDVEGTMASVNATLDGCKQLTEKLNSREGTIGKFLNDPSVYNSLNATMKDADSLMIDLKAHPKRYVHFSIFGKKDK